MEGKGIEGNKEKARVDFVSFLNTLFGNNERYLDSELSQEDGEFLEIVNAATDFTIEGRIYPERGLNLSNAKEAATGRRARSLSGTRNTGTTGSIHHQRTGSTRQPTGTER